MHTELSVKHCHAFNDAGQTKATIAEPHQIATAFVLNRAAGPCCYRSPLCVGREAFAVVANCNNDLRSVALDSNGNRSCFGMLNDIIYRFLNDPVKIDLRFMRKNIVNRIDLRCELDCRGASDSGHDRFDSQRQAEAVKLVRPQVAGDGSYLLNSL